MQRYFFNVYDGTDLFDEEGTKLAGPKEMRLFMLSMAMEIMQKENNWHEKWQIEALDEQGKIVGTMDFGIDQKLAERP